MNYPGIIPSITRHEDGTWLFVWGWRYLHFYVGGD
jgi:hypothetical protein